MVRFSPGSHMSALDNIVLRAQIRTALIVSLGEAPRSMAIACRRW